jgi:hypothetical protein
MEPFCPRSIKFALPAKLGISVDVEVVENNGNLDFTVEVLGTPRHTADLRGLFFHFQESALPGLTLIDMDGAITGRQIQANSVINLGQGVNMNGAAPAFDVGIAFGTPGVGHDLIQGPVHFTLTGARALSVDDIAFLQFGARLTSVGDKITAFAPAAPDAQDDWGTTHEDTPIQLFVLGNDTDADSPDSLKITEVHQEPGAHGAVTVAADGKSLFYTPNKDFAGSNLDPASVDDSFVYCVTDGNGGEDHATVKMHVVPVADQPSVTFDVLAPEADDPINLVRLKVTAAQTDLDGSEFIDRVEFGPLPPGVTLVTDGALDGPDQPDTAVEYVQLMLPSSQDLSFDLGLTAFAQEKGNGNPDEATNGAAQHIEVDFNRNQTQREFAAQDQSIWSSGDAFRIDEHPFLGPNLSFDKSLTFLTPTFPPVPAEAFARGHFKTGLQVDLHIEGGQIDAHLPFDVTVDTTYNRTTDSLLIQTGAELAPGARFETRGPEGAVRLAFVLDFLAELGIEDALGLGIGVSETLKLAPPPLELLNLSSTSPDLPYTLPLPGGLSLGFDWPHLSVASETQSGTLLSGEGASNNFIQLNLDVDYALAQLFPLFAPIEAVLDPDPLAEDNFELLDLDVSGGANFLQKFALEALGLRGTLTFEDGTTRGPFVLGDILPVIRNASNLDGGDPGTLLNFALSLSPDARLNNETSIGLNIGGRLGLLKNIPILDDTLFNAGVSVPIASIPVDDGGPFTLAFGSQSYDFLV